MYGYDGKGRLAATTDPRGVQIQFGYDGSDRLATEASTDGAVTYSHDAAGRRTTMTDPTGTTMWGYDSLVIGMTSTSSQLLPTVRYTDAAIVESMW